jgi:hypothetical protein
MQTIPWPTPAARRCLAAIASAPIVTRERRRKAFVTSADEWIVHTGPHADLLRRMHNEALEASWGGPREVSAAILDADPETLITQALAARTDGYIVRQTLVGDWGRNTGAVDQWEVAPALATGSVEHRRAA